MMDFREAEERFRELKKKVDDGQINQEEFEAELRGLYVIDGESRYWMIGAQTEQWYYYDGSEWVQATPPEKEIQAPVEAVAVEPAPPDLSRPAEGAPRPPRKKASRLAIPILTGLVAACCLLGAASVAVSELVLPSHPLSSFVRGLSGPTVTRPSPVRTIQPSPTTTISAADYIAAGDQLFAAGQYDEALDQYEKAISVDAENAEAYARIGEVYVRGGNCEQAIPEFQQALALDPNLETAQAGLVECGGTLPPEVAFASYTRSDLQFSLLYPSTWSVREEELQTIFAEREEDIGALKGNIFFISSLPLEPGEEDLDDMGALQKAIQLITLPAGSQLGGVEITSFAGWEWAAVQGNIAGLQSPTTIYIASTVKDSTWYGIWAIGPADTWEQTSWPVFRLMANSVKLEPVVSVASPTAEASPPAASPSATVAASPQTSPTHAPATPTSGSPAPAPTPTPKPPTLTGKIAYPVYLGGRNYEVRIATIGGAVLETVAQASEPNLSADGSRVAVRSWDPARRGLLTMNLDGTAQTRIASYFEDSLPRWSADSTSIVYATKRVGPNRISQVFAYSAATGERSLGEGDNPDWSPDRNRVVARTTGLVIMDNAGGSRDQLTFSPSDASPDWSPDGNRIAFMRQTGVNWDIWVINRDGTGEKQLTTDGSVDGLPAWSPNGASIAFLSNRGGSWAIWAMDADGTNQRKLFSTGCATYATTDGFDGEWAGRENWQRRDWVDEQISWSQ
jgi:tetratricopeptide (TPR) repeat protein